MRRLYTVLWYLVLPFVAIAGLRRSRREASRIGRTADTARVFCRERLALSAAPALLAPQGAAMAAERWWVHAASVGEVQLAALLIDALARRELPPTISLSCHTATGRARAETLLPRVSLEYAPYDLPSAMRRRLARLHPRAVVLMETELWPNLLHESARADVPVLVASARLSARSLRAYCRLPSLFRPAMQTHVWVGAQSALDAERFAELGVPAARIEVTGNLKFDRPVSADSQVRGRALRAQIGAARPVWVAGSTHPGEQSILLQAHRQLRQHHPAALLVLAPRHPSRFEEAAGELASAGWRYARRSRHLTSAALAADCEVLLLDTLGELTDFYAAGDVAFVGGSLVSVGGHNLLEPAVLGLPLLAGPYQTNSPDIARLLGEAGALDVVVDARQLADRLGVLIGNDAQRAVQGEHARAALDAHRGALQRLLHLISRLPRPDGAG